MVAVREHAIDIGRWGEIGRAPGHNNPIMGIIPWRRPLAHVAVIRGKEEVDTTSGQRFAETVFRLTFDFYDVKGLEETMILLFDSKKLDIKAIYPDHALKRETVVEAVESETPDA